MKKIARSFRHIFLAKYWIFPAPILAHLPRWKADLLTKAGRRVLVQFVLTSTIIYLAMAIDLPTWALKAIDKV